MKENASQSSTWSIAKREEKGNQLKRAVSAVWILCNWNNNLNGSKLNSFGTAFWHSNRRREETPRWAHVQRIQHIGHRLWAHCDQHLHFSPPWVRHQRGRNFNIYCDQIQLHSNQLRWISSFDSVATEMNKAVPCAWQASNGVHSLPHIQPLQPQLLRMKWNEESLKPTSSFSTVEWQWNSEMWFEKCSMNCYCDWLLRGIGWDELN